MLIDEQNDPHELKNLAAEPAHADTVKNLKQMLGRLK